MQGPSSACHLYVHSRMFMCVYGLPRTMWSSDGRPHYCRTHHRMLSWLKRDSVIVPGHKDESHQCIVPVQRCLLQGYCVHAPHCAHTLHTYNPPTVHTSLSFSECAISYSRHKSRTRATPGVSSSCSLSGVVAAAAGSFASGPLQRHV